MNEPRFEVYRVVDAPNRDYLTGNFTWRFRSANGQITAIGGEGFIRREDAHRAVEDFERSTGIGYEQSGMVFDPEIVDVDD